MVFCFVSGYCTRSALAIFAVLVRMALKERAIRAAPLSPLEVLRGYLKLGMLWRGMDEWPLMFSRVSVSGGSWTGG